MDRIHAIGGRLWVEGGKLKYHLPKTPEGEELKAELREFKPEIIAHLEAQARTTHPPEGPITHDQDGGNGFLRLAVQEAHMGLPCRHTEAVDAAADILTPFPGAKVIAVVYYVPIWKQFWQVIERHFPGACEEERITRAAEVNRDVMNIKGPAFFGLGHYINDRLDELWRRIPEDRRQ
jgi:hypothetical protein